MLGISEVVVIESFRDVPEDCEAFVARAAQGNDLNGVAEAIWSRAAPGPIEGRCHMGNEEERDVVAYYPLDDLELGEGGEPVHYGDPESLLIAAEEQVADEIAEYLHGADANAILRVEAKVAEQLARHEAAQDFLCRFQQPNWCPDDEMAIAHAA